MQPGGGAIFSSRAAANANAIGSVSGVPVGDPRAIVAVEQPACASVRTPKGWAQNRSRRFYGRSTAPGWRFPKPRHSCDVRDAWGGRRDVSWLVNGRSCVCGASAFVRERQASCVTQNNSGLLVDVFACCSRSGISFCKKVASLIYDDQ